MKLTMQELNHFLWISYIADNESRNSKTEELRQKFISYGKAEHYVFMDDYFKEEDPRTSEDWQKLYNGIIYDPDGWDRKNYQFSWHEEKISRKEFERRACMSTQSGLSKGPIWKDEQEVI
jgi:hypothetical protein